MTRPTHVPIPTGNWHESVVLITIRENQQPADEFICLIFEALNSEGEKHFQEIIKRAEPGILSRTNFASEILKVEFEAVKKLMICWEISNLMKKKQVNRIITILQPFHSMPK